MNESQLRERILDVVCENGVDRASVLATQQLAGKIDSLKLLEVIEKENISWRSFWNGEQGTKGPISSEWNVKGWPTLYVLDPQGVIRYKWVGGPGEKVIDAALDKLIKEAEWGAKKPPR